MLDATAEVRDPASVPVLAAQRVQAIVRAPDEHERVERGERPRDPAAEPQRPSRLPADLASAPTPFGAQHPPALVRRKPQAVASSSDGESVADARVDPLGTREPLDVARFGHPRDAAVERHDPPLAVEPEPGIGGRFAGEGDPPGELESHGGRGRTGAAGFGRPEGLITERGRRVALGPRRRADREGDGERRGERARGGHGTTHGRLLAGSAGRVCRPTGPYDTSRAFRNLR